MTCLLRHLDDEIFTQILLTTSQSETTTSSTHSSIIPSSSHPCPNPDNSSNNPTITITTTKIAGPLTNEHLTPITTRNWKALLSWTTFHPEQVSSLRDTRGQTALHHACLFKAPAYVVDAILYASPESAYVCNQDGELPIHWAVRVAAPVEILRLLLNAAPKCGLMRDGMGETALSLLWDRCRERLVEMAREERLEVVVGMEPEERFKRRGVRGTGWRMMMLLLRPFYCGGGGDGCCCGSNAATADDDVINFQPLHAATGSPVPLSFFKLVCSLYPHQIMERDDHGRLPLAVAASSVYSNRTIIDILLALYPEGALVPDREGRYPLVLGLESGKVWDEGIGSLFEAAPQVLGLRDGVSGLYPFMLASVEEQREDDVNERRHSNYDGADEDPRFDGFDDSHQYFDGGLEKLDTTFRLLLADPECVRML